MLEPHCTFSSTCMQHNINAQCKSCTDSLQTFKTTVIMHTQIKVSAAGVLCL